MNKFHFEPKEARKIFFAKKQSGEKLYPVVIDQFSGQEFNKNEFGWPRSDVSAIMQADAENIQDRLMSRLKLLKDDPTNAGKSDKQLIQELIPRNVQSYGELSAYMDWYKKTYGEPLFAPERGEEIKKDEDNKEQTIATDMSSESK